MAVADVPSAALDQVERLHGAVDAMCRPLLAQHAGRLRCARGCAGCCVDELTVFEVEAALVAQHHLELLRDGEPHAPGACAFLDREGACPIYPHRPYVCRTQGLPLRWLEPAPDDADTVLELRDICALNDVGDPLASLEPGACWTLGPVEDWLAGLQRSVDGGELRRVALRSLFQR